MDRRSFLRKAGLVGGGCLFSPLLAGEAAPPAASPAPADPRLRGVCDLHIHAAPDVKGRTVNELELARRAQAAHYKAVLFKSNVWPCHDRAYLAQQALPGFACYGSLVMNLALGERVNPYAVEQTLKTTGNLCRCIWMPTQDAVYQAAMERGRGVKGSGKRGIPVTDSSGKVLPEVLRVMELCAEADIMFATGHSSPAESLAMAQQARDIGLRKFVITHANSLIWRLAPDQIRQAVDSGAWIEYSYITRLWGPGTGLPTLERQSAEEFASYVALAPERSFVSTDLGSMGLPEPLAGMRLCLDEMEAAGLPERDIDLLVRTNPAGLLGLE